MTDHAFWPLQRTLAFEFSKYVLAHPEVDTKIPEGAQVVFLLAGEERFNTLSKRHATAQHQPGQPIVFVRVKGLRPPIESRLISPHLEPVGHF